MVELQRSRVDARARIVEAAAQLLREHGPAAVTTRGVAEAAGVQAPAIYRLFGDKDGLLEAVAEHVMAGYVSDKAGVLDAATAADLDPLEDLRSGWHAQINFGLANPALFRLLSDPDRVRQSVAAANGRQILEARVHRIATAGRLKVGERHAVSLIQAAGIGTIQTLLATPPDDRDPSLAGAMIEAVLRQILTDAPAQPDNDATATTVAFRTLVPRLGALSDAERKLLAEWLDRTIEDRRH
jgi:AcrR family transcriptional regulator